MHGCGEKKPRFFEIEVESMIKQFGGIHADPSVCSCVFNKKNDACASMRAKGKSCDIVMPREGVDKNGIFT